MDSAVFAPVIERVTNTSRKSYYTARSARAVSVLDISTVLTQSRSSSAPN